MKTVAIVMTRCFAVADNEKVAWTVPLIYGAREHAKATPLQTMFDTETVSINVPCKVWIFSLPTCLSSTAHVSISRLLSLGAASLLRV